MKVCFDTSVLVAAMVEDHPDHDKSLDWLQKVAAKTLQAVIAAHTLAELYAVLTVLPVRPRLDPDTVMTLLTTNVSSNFEVVGMTKRDYLSVLEMLADRQITGGATYDGLIAWAALKTKADLLLTLNPKHFSRLLLPGSRVTVRSPYE